MDCLPGTATPSTADPCGRVADFGRTPALALFKVHPSSRSFLSLAFSLVFKPRLLRALLLLRELHLFHQAAEPSKISHSDSRAWATTLHKPQREIHASTHRQIAPRLGRYSSALAKLSWKRAPSKPRSVTAFPGIKLDPIVLPHPAISIQTSSCIHDANQHASSPSVRRTQNRGRV